ncbi:leucine rich adaptor protein 1 [Tiliqua scincoides]|uniref:leucine rich adaptor protein 1 n=1 Tax=Tiliqua scincoides TaxID=71010 RepID=UPI0034634603
MARHLQGAPAPRATAGLARLLRPAAGTFPASLQLTCLPASGAGYTARSLLLKEKAPARRTARACGGGEPSRAGLLQRAIGRALGRERELTVCLLRPALLSVRSAAVAALPPPPELPPSVGCGGAPLALPAQPPLLSEETPRVHVQPDSLQRPCESRRPLPRGGSSRPLGMEAPGGCAELPLLPPDLKDLESKVGLKPPDGLLRWLREDPTAHLLRGSPSRGLRNGLGEKIRALKLELAYLRAIDIKILQQLVAVNEGIEAVKWLLEEKGMLTSHCSSLTSSQYSLVESQETSRRGSWNSLLDPNDKLDSISIGSYLDTLADDMDEYGQGSSVEPIMSSTPGRPLTKAELERSKVDLERALSAKSAIIEQEKNKAYHEKVPSLVRSQGSSEQNRAATQSPPVANGLLGRQVSGMEQSLETKLASAVAERSSKGSPAAKASRNSKGDSENCKLNSRRHLEYDAHWHWVQSQDDVTFL